MTSEHPINISDSEKRRLPPGQEEIEELPAVSKSSVPKWPSNWTLRIFGSVEEERRYNLSQLKKMAETLSQNQDFHCVEGWSKLDIEWTGIRFKDLIYRVEVKDEAQHVLFHALDDYKTNLPLEVCMGNDVLVAWKLNGEEIPRKYGGRVRVVLERKYAYKGAKWLSGIELMEKHRKGYWEKRGYSDSANPWREERYSD